MGGAGEAQRRGEGGSGLGSGSNYVAVSILSHLTAAWNPHHSSHGSP